MKKIVWLFIVIASCSLNANAQSIYFNFTNGTNGQYPLVDVQKIDFAGNVMQLHLNSGTMVSWNVSTIATYRYQPMISPLEEIKSIAIKLDVSPNPSDGLVRIQYSLPQNQVVQMGIYDIQGRLVEEKMLGTQLLGSYVYDWVASQKGIYLIKLMTEQQTISKKVIIE
jgi:hypothetical protein